MVESTVEPSREEKGGSGVAASQALSLTTGIGGSVEREKEETEEGDRFSLNNKTPTFFHLLPSVSGGRRMSFLGAGAAVQRPRSCAEAVGSSRRPTAPAPAPAAAPI